MSFNLMSIMGMFRPTLKSNDTIINKLKAAKTTEPGGMTDTLQKVLQGGLGKMLQNPSGGSGGKAKQNTQSASNQASTKYDMDTGGYNSVADGFTGLAADIQDLMDQAAEIVGLGSDDTGFLTTLGWTQIAENFPIDSPYRPEVILKPANAEAELEGIAAQVLIISNEYVLGNISSADALFRINLMREEISGITTASQAAISVISSTIVALTSAVTSGALLVSGTAEWQSIMERAIQDEAKSDVLLGNQELLRID